jgi:hypothetical protein
VALELAVSVAMAFATVVCVPVISAFDVGGVSGSVFDASADDDTVVVVLIAVVVAVEDAVDSGPIVDDAAATALADLAIDPIAVAVAVAVAVAPNGADPSITVTVAIAAGSPSPEPADTSTIGSCSSVIVTGVLPFTDVVVSSVLFVVFFVSDALTSVCFVIVVLVVVVVNVSGSMVVAVTVAVALAKACPPISSRGLVRGVSVQTGLPQPSLPQTPLSDPAP